MNKELIADTSLYDFLGKKAGSKLGRIVNKEAQALNVPVAFREVSNPKYEGKILLYPRLFLEQFFKRHPTLKK
jgi:hypothetical protein